MKERFFGFLQWCVRDFWRKLVALFLASLLYFAVSLQTGGSIRVNDIPVEIEPPQGLVNLGSRTVPVTLTLKGARGALDSLSRSDIRAKIQVPIEAYTPNRACSVRLQPGDFRLPPGVWIDTMEPRDLVLNLEGLASRKVPVKARFDSLSKLSRDYTVTLVRFNPAEVHVTGPESVVSEIPAVYTEPIPLDGSVTDSFEYQTVLRNPGQVTLSPARLTAQVDVARYKVTKEFKNVPVLLMNPPGTAGRFAVELLSAPTAEVTLSGPAGRIAGLKTPEIRAYLDLSGCTEPGTYKIAVGCTLENSGELEIRSIYPETIQVKLSKR